jgi:hypothetical protein
MHPQNSFYVEVGYFQKNHHGERICGDTFLSQKVKEENRVVVVLSDGMGHGVKANMLSTLTATMALNFTKEHKDPNKIAEIIMNTLPVCSVRKVSYSTFTIVDIEESGKTTILNYDNPDPIVIRASAKFNLKWQNIILESEKNRGKEIKVCSFQALKEDRIVLLTDGVTQSGLGKEKSLLGWEFDNVVEMIKKSLEEKPDISATRLSTNIVIRAHSNDDYQPKDDISCGVIYLRSPRKLLLCSGPPFDKEKDAELARVVNTFDGRKILCGGTTADIISRELNIPIHDTLEFDDPDLPPLSEMKGIDLVSEGILTLSKVSQVLENLGPATDLGKGPADLIVKMFLESDEINFWVGTAINIAHQDPNLPVELEIRRTVIKKIARILEQKHLKEVKLQFI